MVVDDHPIMRDGLRDALETSDRIQVVGLASDGEEAVSAARRLGPQVIVMDVIMPGMNGIDACREIMELLPDTRVVMMTASNEEDAVVEAIAAGATGYLEKYSRPEELVESVVDVAEGRLRLPEQAMKRVFTMFREYRTHWSHQPLERLTDVERDTLVMFARGMSYPEIAAERGKSTATVQNTLYRVQDKLGIERKQELVVWAVRNGLLDGMPPDR